MQYYKIIDHGNVIGVGTMLLKWFSSAGRFFYCDSINDAEAVQDVLTERLYRDDWLRKPPDGAIQPTPATVSLINSAEYEELYALLIDGEDIPVDPEPEPEPQPEPAPEPEPEPEKPMTIQEMRAAITQMQQEINGEDMTAHEHIRPGAYFSVGMRIYQATDAIVKGEALQPGRNCTEVPMAVALNELNTGKENE